MTPPWPSKAFYLGHAAVRHVAFSPSGSQLALCINNYSTDQYVNHVWDRWGEETLLGVHGKIHCMEYSLDGQHLASGSGNGSIRIWLAESFHTTTSKPYMERPTRIPKQADTILVGSRGSSKTLSFSRTDSNILASGGPNGEIKVWNIREQACIHSSNPDCGWISALFFAGGADIACIALAGTSVIRLWKPEGSSDLASGIIGNADMSRFATPAVFSPSGSFLATHFQPTRNVTAVTLYELDTTTTKIQSVVMVPGVTAACFAVTPDSKQLIIGDHRGKIRLLQTCDLDIQRDLDPRGEVLAMPGVWSVAFDPACRFLAVGCDEGRLELRSL
jgi:WD40 repeat protein